MRSDGSTACVCLFENKTLWTANVGDTKAALAVDKKGTVKGVTLSRDHLAEKPEEQKRIEAEYPGKGYVQNGRVLGYLAVSRSFGDRIYKQKGVSAVPCNPPFPPKN